MICDYKMLVVLNGNWEIEVLNGTWWKKNGITVELLPWEAMPPHEMNHKYILPHLRVAAYD